jgi:acyl-CoA synthetase (AMP-forming)/AMP-acid ligase II
MLRQDSRLTSADIMTFFQQRMQRYMVPSEIVIIDSLPMNRHGKIIKSALKEQVKEAM